MATVEGLLRDRVGDKQKGGLSRIETGKQEEWVILTEADIDPESNQLLPHDDKRWSQAVAPENLLSILSILLCS